MKYVYKRSSTDYVIGLEADGSGGGYNVVPKSVDPCNGYEIADVEAYLVANPDKLLVMEGYWHTIGTRSEVYAGVRRANAEAITQEQYEALLNPSPNQLWMWFREDLSASSPTAQREALYGFLCYRLVGDVLAGDLDLSRPFYDSLTVDGMSQAYLRYLGDDDIRAQAYLTGKMEAKKYIRGLYN